MVKFIRTTFVRRIKSSTSESKAKKLYCLNEAKQFTLPFIKTCSTLTRNFSPVSDEDFETADFHHQIYLYHYAPNQPNPSTSNSIPLFTTQSESELVNISELTFIKLKPTTGKKLERNTNLNFSSTDANKAFFNYFETKRPKLAATASDAKTDSLKHLIPDLLSMLDMHLRTYKRRSIELIDNILSTPHMNNVSSVATY
ncbi:hypothetical protein AGLY_014828 [Aphis glycines]|uniref:BESS domain-containing protein n=1 Tax=Aphis glycines TaxID=307491 RepID=A0A6G0T2Z3_APHGL|nr:hypothetical protein AGLY_014828 [Aphis glycines]